MSFKDQALNAIARGLFVIPLAPNSKAAVHPNWQELGTQDLEQIEKWNTENPDYGVGAACSKQTTWIYDVDSPDWWYEQENKPNFSTLAIRTGGGGIQYHFLQDDYSREKLSNKSIRNPGMYSKADGSECSNVADILHDRRQGVFSGVHPKSGRDYAVLSDLPLASAPPEFIDWIVSKLAAPANDVGKSKQSHPFQVLSNHDEQSLEKMLVDKGLKFHKQVKDGKTYWNYHTDMGKCLSKGSLHGPNANNNACCAFVYDFSIKEFWHHCMTTGCGDGWDTSTQPALANLGIDPKTVYKSPKKSFFLKFARSMSVLEYEELDWLWFNIILKGVVNLFVGLPDAGKTLVAVYIIARLSRGECFPFSAKKVKRQKTVVICREDSYNSMWKPRLLAAGADLDYVIPVFGVGDEPGPDGESMPWYLDEQSHRDALKTELLKDPEIGLCVIDPLGDMLAHSDLNKAPDVRRVMGPLGTLAEETGVAVILNCHTTKALIDSVIKMAAGSIQIMAAVQVSFWFTENPDKKNERLMLQGRNKSGKKRGFAYEIISAPWPVGLPPRDLEEGEEDDGVGLVVFKKRTDIQANDLLAKQGEKGESANSRIRRWLNELLGNGNRVSAEQCNAESDARGFDRNAVTQICMQLKVKRDGKFWWIEIQEGV